MKAKESTAHSNRVYTSILEGASTGVTQLLARAVKVTTQFLTFGELEALACSCPTWLVTLTATWVAGEEAVLL